MSKKTTGLDREQVMDFAVLDGNSFAKASMECRRCLTNYYSYFIFNNDTAVFFCEWVHVKYRINGEWLTTYPFGLSSSGYKLLFL